MAAIARRRRRLRGGISFCFVLGEKVLLGGQAHDLWLVGGEEEAGSGHGQEVLLLGVA